MAEREGTFYPIWPTIDSKPLNLQWGQIRSNTAETKAIVRNSVQELGTGEELNALRALLGQEYGDLDFRNKFRLYYNKTTLELCLQKNDGTVDVPIWVDAWCVRFHDGQFQAVGGGGIYSAAGFYTDGDTLSSLREIGESGSLADKTFQNPTKLFFNTDDGLELQEITSGANQGAPEVRFTAPFGKSEVFAKSGKEWIVQHNFGVSPLMVQVMDADRRVVIPDKADLSDPNIAYFYFHAPVSGEAMIASGGLGAVALVPRDPFYLVVRTNTDSSDGRLMQPNAHLVFDASQFYVDVDLDTDAGGSRKQAFVSIHTVPANAVNHGDLGGLSDDDHPQYILADGSRAFSGDVDFGDNNLTNVGLLDGSVHVENAVTAEAFYIKDGGELTRDHSLLDNLSADDHPQYILADGSRAFSGDVDFGDNNLTNVGLLDGSVHVENAVTAEAFYIKNGGELTRGTWRAAGDIIVKDMVQAAGFYLKPGTNGLGRSLNSDTLSFDIPTVLVDNYWLESFVDQGFIIKDAQIKTQFGTCSVAFYIHGDGERHPGVSITGLDPLTASINKSVASATGNNVVRRGDSLVLSVPSNTVAVHLRGRLKIELSG